MGCIFIKPLRISKFADGEVKANSLSSISIPSDLGDLDNLGNDQDGAEANNMNMDMDDGDF